MVRGTVVLPHGTGKVVRVAVFAQGEKAQEALRAGADEVGAEDLVKKIEAGWLEFDVALATPGHDGHGRPARQDPRPARPDAEPEVRHDHLRPRARHPRGQGAAGSSSRSTRPASSTSPFGKVSFEADALVANLAALVDAINRAKPSGAKGQYLKGLTIASTMGPGIRVDVPARPRGRRRLTDRSAPPAALPTRGDRHPRPRRTRVALDNRTSTDRRRQPAPADRAPATGLTVGA